MPTNQLNHLYEGSESPGVQVPPGTIWMSANGSAYTFDGTSTWRNWRVPDGTAALPGLVPGSDPDTGLFSRAANVLAVSTGGAQRAEFAVVGLRVGGTAAHATTAGTNIISMYAGTAPAGTLASGGSLYVATATNVELNYIDSAGTAQQLSTT